MVPSARGLRDGAASLGAETGVRRAAWRVVCQLGPRWAVRIVRPRQLACGRRGELCVSTVLAGISGSTSFIHSATRADRVCLRASAGAPDRVISLGNKQHAAPLRRAPAHGQDTRVGVLAVRATVSCQPAPLDSSVRSGSVPRRSKLSGARESCPACAGRSAGATHLHGRFRTEGDRDTSVTGEVVPSASLVLVLPATRLVRFGVSSLPPRAARLQDCDCVGLLVASTPRTGCPASRAAGRAYAASAPRRTPRPSASRGAASAPASARWRTSR